MAKLESPTSFTVLAANDRLVAASIIVLGAGAGVLCSTVNPFATGTRVAHKTAVHTG